MQSWFFFLWSLFRFSFSRTLRYLVKFSPFGLRNLNLHLSPNWALQGWWWQFFGRMLAPSLFSAQPPLCRSERMTGVPFGSTPAAAAHLRTRHALWLARKGSEECEIWTRYVILLMVLVMSYKCSENNGTSNLFLLDPRLNCETLGLVTHNLPFSYLQ